jgi:hypothetical protein
MATLGSWMRGEEMDLWRVSIWDLGDAVVAGCMGTVAT